MAGLYHSLDLVTQFKVYMSWSLWGDLDSAKTLKKKKKKKNIASSNPNTSNSVNILTLLERMWLFPSD